MSVKVVLSILLCGIYLCSANPVRVPQNFKIGDDKSNWEALWSATKDDSAVSRSDDEDIFDRIVRINAKERGSGVGRTDEDVFLFEGDIEMNKSDAINIIQGNGKARHTRAVTRTRRQNLWPRNVPYAIDSSLARVTGNIKNAIKEWEETLPCLGNWQDVTSRSSKPSDYMYFFRGSGCYSKIGRVGGAQRISIGNGCQYHGVVVHEIGHAMGLWHEQSRPDRDNYVTILWNNIIPAMKFNFRKQSSTRINSFGVSYDYGSVMHYGSYAFSRYKGKRTIVSKEAGQRLGQRNGLSVKDKEQLRRLYGCTTKPTTKPTVKPTTKPNPSGCQANLQSDHNCEYWKGLGFCQKTYVEYMKKNCCKTCAPVASCTDKNTGGNCPKWAASGFCSSSSQYYSYMRDNCAKSCGCISK